MNMRVTELRSVSTIVFTGVLFLLSIPAAASSECTNLKGCERKFCEIERQLNIALENNNKRKADGLRKSLIGAKEHCTEKGLREDLVEEMEEAEEDVTEYELNLKEAKEYGKEDKVRKYEEKIEEKKRKIESLQDKLSIID